MIFEIDKYNLPNMRDYGSVRTTDTYTIAEYESRGLRLDKLAERLAGEIGSYFILYDYKANIYTDNDEVIELLKEWHPSGDYPCHDGDNLNIDFDQILLRDSDGNYTWAEYVARWGTVYRKLAKALLNFKKSQIFSNEKSIGKTLYSKCFADIEFVDNNEWVKKFAPVWKVESLDPIHIFASINGNSLSYKKRVERINILFRLLSGNFKNKYKDIDFDGCPAPMIVNIIGARGKEDQNEAWEYFEEVMTKSQSAAIDFNHVKSWYGIDIGAFSLFLFWIDSKNFLPLDKNTVALLEKYKKLTKYPSTFEEYKNLLPKKDTDLYRNLALVAYDSSKQDTLNEYQLNELQVYLGIKNATVEVAGNKVKMLVGNVNVIIEDANNGVKIISIKPLSGCNKDFLKTLKENENYIFDKAYDIQTDDKIVVDKDLSLSLFDIEGLKININAIVGKNGTGKSTIVELLFAMVNNLGCKKKINDDLKYIDDLRVELIFETSSLYKIVMIDDNVHIFKYRKQDSEYVLGLEPLNMKDFDLNSFFYTIAVNYSQHALNDLHFGEWLNSLFHKNDAYQTPIVLEPFRKNGNTDINRQSGLVKQRLLTNLLEQEGETGDNFKNSPRRLTEYRTTYLKLVFNKKKLFHTDKNIKKIMSATIYKDDDGLLIKYSNCRTYYKDALEKLYSKFGLSRKVLIDFNASYDSYTFDQKVDLYILKKIISIANKYKHYQIYFNRANKSFQNIDEYCNGLNEDRSHITYKLRQAINFLKFNTVIQKQEAEQIIDIEKLSDDIQTIKINPENKELELSTIELIPPSFFSVDIILGNGSSFEQLSSGEKQKIYSMNSILYHLNNLNSVSRELPNRYERINIVLDEVELYFHPELQRTYLSDLHRVLKKANPNNIMGINIMFVTHSPFILSDIPDTKILFLDKDSNDVNAKTKIVKGVKTFGANIHELLINGFFMKDSMGEFALSQIKLVVDFHKRVLNSDEKELEGLKNEYETIKDKFDFICRHIGEEYVSGILENHIADIEEKLLSTDDIKQKRIEQLKAELKKLEGNDVKD